MLPQEYPPDLVIKPGIVALRATSGPATKFSSLLPKSKEFPYVEPQECLIRRILFPIPKISRQ